MIRRNRYLTARQQEILQRLRDLADSVLGRHNSDAI